MHLFKENVRSVGKEVRWWAEICQKATGKSSPDSLPITPEPLRLLDFPSARTLKPLYNQLLLYTQTLTYPQNSGLTQKLVIPSGLLVTLPNRSHVKNPVLRYHLRYNLWC